MKRREFMAAGTALALIPTSITGVMKMDDELIAHSAAHDADIAIMRHTLAGIKSDMIRCVEITRWCDIDIMVWHYRLILRFIADTPEILTRVWVDSWNPAEMSAKKYANEMRMAMDCYPGQPHPIERLITYGKDGTASYVSPQWRELLVKQEEYFKAHSRHIQYLG